MSTLVSAGSGRDAASLLNDLAKDVGRHISKGYGDFLEALRDRIRDAEKVRHIVESGKGRVEVIERDRGRELRISFLPSSTSRDNSYFVSITRDRFTCTCTDFMYNAIWFERAVLSRYRDTAAIDIERMRNISICKHVIAAIDIAIRRGVLRIGDERLRETAMLGLFALAARYTNKMVEIPEHLLVRRRIIDVGWNR
jgi:hypothetical protein